MAEFSEVMRQWRRMCSACRCSSKDEMKDFPLCPIITEHKGYPCDEYPQDWSEDATKQFEEIVMDWAAEHPEPVYPSWIDWLMSEGVIPTNYMVANSTDSGVRAGTFYVTSKAFEPIPADIVEKLGIEPKEGT